MLLKSGTSSVLLNNVPGKKFYSKRGVRQGDPLSPLLFVLAADLLQSILNDALGKNLVNLPLNTSSGQDFPVIQYADDTLLVMEADAKQIICLKALLQTFASSTGLKVNFHKSMMVPLNLSEERAEHFTRTLGCKQGSMPFTYLGLPLGTTKPPIESFLPLVEGVERRLSGIANFLNTTGKLEMVKTVLASITTFMMCTRTTYSHQETA